jgi:ATP-binding cassette subfamily E protein 1
MEDLCVGCGICVKKCPFGAISIINLPANLERETVHRYGPNGFKLHRLPIPRRGEVLGLVGSNGTGKSTALKILGNKLKPNLGQYEMEPGWEEIITHFRGNELQNYLTRMVEHRLVTVLKPQYVDIIPRTIKGVIGNLIAKRDQRAVSPQLIIDLELGPLLNHKVGDLSGGELQRFALMMTLIRQADIYMFDEPSSYLDVKQRLIAARSIRSLLGSDTFVICVEHDLAILDYLSDYVHVLYGTPSAYGVVTAPFSVREGINIFLDGFVPTENVRFRETALRFISTETVEDAVLGRCQTYTYPSMSRTVGQFRLDVMGGTFASSQITVMLGQNGSGKTTFIRMLTEAEVLPLKISYKPQKIAPKFSGTVRQLLRARIGDAHLVPQFQTDVAKPLQLETLLDLEVTKLSGGELQRVALILCLGKPADVYLIDEPSAYLDSEQRIIAARVIKRFIMHAQRSCFVVEHDFIMATYLADQVIVYSGLPGIECRAHAPQSLVSGMNIFLAQLDVTFRRDPTNHRPRINKLDSIKDRAQKLSGNFFFLED